MPQPAFTMLCYVVPMYITLLWGSSLFIRFFSCSEGFEPSEIIKKLLYTQHDQPYATIHTDTHRHSRTHQTSMNEILTQPLDKHPLLLLRPEKKINRYTFFFSISICAQHFGKTKATAVAATVWWWRRLDRNYAINTASDFNKCLIEFYIVLLGIKWDRSKFILWMR